MMGAHWINRDYLAPIPTPPTLLETLDVHMRSHVPAYAGATLAQCPEPVRDALLTGLASPYPLTVIHGPTRAGKTRALWAARRHCASVGDRRSWLIATGADLLGSRGSLDQDLWRRAKTVDVLAIDDLMRGITTWTDREATRMTEMLTARFGRSTICTDNRDPRAIDRAQFGADFSPLFGRLLEAKTASYARTVRTAR